jgi:hypothetical protein
MRVAFRQVRIFAGSSRASIQVKIAKRLEGGSASFPLSPKSLAYLLFAEATSLNPRSALS